MDVISNAKNAKAVCVEGGEKNPNNYIQIREPPVSFRSGFWKHFSFRVNVHNGKEVVEREIKTVCKLCHNDASYKSGNICNMSSPWNWIFVNCIPFSSIRTLLLPRQRLLLANYVKKTCKKLLYVNPNWVKSPPRLGQSLAFELINTVLNSQYTGAAILYSCSEAAYTVLLQVYIYWRAKERIQNIDIIFL